VKGSMLYDLVADPLEATNRSAEDVAGVAGARAVLDEAHAACAGWHREHPSVEPAAHPPSGAEPAWFVNRDDIERKLRSLGYAQ